MRTVFSSCSWVLAVLLLGGCNDRSDSVEQSDGVEQRLRLLVSEAGLTGDPASGRDLPSIDSPVARLGMQLFFSKALGGDMDAACVSCHHPLLGGGDNLSLSIGVEAEQPDLLGPGRVHSSAGHHYDGGPTVPRNAPSTFNIVFYDEVLFYDGRVESLGKLPRRNGTGSGIRTPDSAFGVADPDAGASLSEAQARFPVTSKEEMRGFSFEVGNSNAAVRAHLEQRLRDEVVELAENRWLDAFRNGLEQPTGTAGELITYDNIAAALGAYQNSQVLTDTPWKAWVQGDASAISGQAKRGGILFFSPVDEGGAGCSVCHEGDFFTDEQFHVLAMPQIGRGKGDGFDGTEDFGRYRETGNPDDKYAFRTPHLLNVSETGPWGHAGGYTRLEAVVRHHLNPQHAIDNYDFNQLDPLIRIDRMTANTQKALGHLSALQAAGKSRLRQADLNDEQVAALLAFLETLTDPCLRERACMSQWIPDDQLPDPDGLRIQAFTGL